MGRALVVAAEVGLSVGEAAGVVVEAGHFHERLMPVIRRESLRAAEALSHYFPQCRLQRRGTMMVIGLLHKHCHIEVPNFEILHKCQGTWIREFGPERQKSELFGPRGRKPGK